MKSLKKHNRFSSLGLLVFLLVFAVIGSYLLFRGFAATPKSYGDLNNDGVVNAIDLSIILSNYNTTNTAGDANGDGTVNALDLSVVLSHFGTNTPPSCPSGQCMPVGDIQGWHQIFSDDFNTNVPSGAGVASGGQAGYFPQAVSSKWTAYPWPWTGTPSWANYFPERTTSFHDSLMDIWMHSETINGTDYHLIDDPEPCLNTTNCSSNPGYLSGGRYVMRFKTDNFGYYHASWLLWPQTDDNGSVHWPASGEIDYPEADFNGNIYGFMHNQDGTSGGDQQEFATAVPVSSGWHTAMIEWVAGTYCRFTLDSTVVGYTTTRVPTSPMRFNLQNGGSFANNGAVAPDAVNGHVYFDWVTVYTPN